MNKDKNNQINKYEKHKILIKFPKIYYYIIGLLFIIFYIISNNITKSTHDDFILAIRTSSISIKIIPRWDYFISTKGIMNLLFALIQTIVLLVICFSIKKTMINIRKKETIEENDKYSEKNDLCKFICKKCGNQFKLDESNKLYLKLKCNKEDCKFKEKCGFNKGVALKPNNNIRSIFKCKGEQVFNLSYDKIIKKINNHEIKHTDVNKYLEIICSECGDKLNIYEGKNKTFLLFGNRNNGKTSFIMNIYHNISEDLKKNTYNPSIIFNDSIFNDEDSEYKYKYYDDYKTYDDEAGNVIMEATEDNDSKNHSFTYTDGSKTLNFSDRKGESMKAASRIGGYLINTLPSYYDGSILIYTAFKCDSFIRYYKIKGENTDERDSLYSISVLFNNINNYLSEEKPFAFVLQQTDKSFKVKEYDEFLNRVYINDDKYITIYNDDNDSLIIDSNGNYHFKLLEYEIGTYAIKNIQNLLYNLKKGLSIDECVRRLKETKTGKVLYTLLFTYILNNLNNNIIIKSDMFVSDYQGSQILLLNYETISFASLNEISEELGIGYITNGFNLVNNNFDIRDIDINKKILQFIIKYNLGKLFNMYEGIHDENLIMNFLGLCFVIAYGSAEVYESFYNYEKIKYSLEKTSFNKEKIEKIINNRHFFTASAYYKNFENHRINNKIKIVVSKYENDDIPNVDNRTLNVLNWISK